MLPVALLAMMSGSLLGGFALSLFGNQSAADSGSAFLGCFALVFVAGLIAPTKRGKTSLVFAGLIALLALVSLVISFTTSVEGFADRPYLLKILIPTSQILGGLYAAFLLPPLATSGTMLEQLWKEITALGAVVIILGVAISLGGVIARMFVGTWVGVFLGLGVVTLGIATWLFPFAHIFLRMRGISAAMDHEKA